MQPVPSAGKLATGAQCGKTQNQYQAREKVLPLPSKFGFGFLKNTLYFDVLGGKGHNILLKSINTASLSTVINTTCVNGVFFFSLRCRFVASNSQLQYSDIADGKPVTLSMAIDNLESLKRQLNDVEKKVGTIKTTRAVKRPFEI